MSMMGLLHRSIEVVTVLMSDPPVMIETWNIEQLKTQFRSRDTSDQAKHAGLVKDVVVRLSSLADECRGFVTFTSRDAKRSYASVFGGREFFVHSAHGSFAATVRGHATGTVRVFDRVSAHSRSHTDHHILRVTGLQKPLSKEMGDYTWEFDAQRIAKMLSAADKCPPDPLVNLAHKSLEGNALPVWPSDYTNQVWYAPLAKFLNGCVDACHQALDEHSWPAQRSSRFYDRLNFIAYDKPTAEAIQGTSPVQPDLVGGLDLMPNERVAWELRNTSESIKQALIPVEVGMSTSRIVVQASAYARYLFSATPSRQFAVALGVLPRLGKLRFFVFHRSGLTASQLCSVKDPQGQKDILRMFLSILEWTSANDAGFLEFFNGLQMSLPLHEGDETGVIARITRRLYQSVSDNATEAVLMEYGTGWVTEPEFCFPSPDQTPGTYWRPKACVQSDPRNNETRMSFTSNTDRWTPNA